MLCWRVRGERHKTEQYELLAMLKWSQISCSDRSAANRLHACGDVRSSSRKLQHCLLTASCGLPVSDAHLNTTSGLSVRLMGLFVGTTATGSLYMPSNSLTSVAAVPVMPASLGKFLQAADRSTGPKLSTSNFCARMQIFATTGSETCRLHCLLCWGIYLKVVPSRKCACHSDKEGNPELQTEHYKPWHQSYPMYIIAPPQKLYSRHITDAGKSHT